MNGKTGEMVRWLIALGVTALVAYFTSKGAIESELASVKARQESQFGEVLRRLEVMQQDIREIRAADRLAPPARPAPEGYQRSFDR